jgi:hypothetical protein
MRWFASLSRSVRAALAVGALSVFGYPQPGCPAQPKIPKLIVPAQPLAPAQEAAMIRSVTGDARPIADKDVFAVYSGHIVRLTDENIGTVLSKPTLTAEVFNEPAARIQTPAVFKQTGAAHLDTFSFATRYTTISPGHATPVVFKVVMAVLQSLHYDGSAGEFVGRIALSLINPSDENDHSRLPQELSVLIGADGGQTDPDEVAFRQLNTLAEVKLTTQTPSNPFRVRAITALTQSPDSIDVPVELSEIQVRSVSPSIRGFGLEETNLMLQVPAARGKAGEAIALTTSLGTISGSPVTLDSTGSGVAVLHSSAVGVAVITATSSVFQSGEAAVKFKWPLATLVATLLGAIVGSTLRSDTRKTLLRSLLIGILAALVIVASYAAGVSGKFWGAPPGMTGEAVFFFLAAISGFLGSNALATFSKGSGT